MSSVSARISKVFQSTPSAWRETHFPGRCSGRRRFQSTPSAWRETCVIEIFHAPEFISIHSLRMEGDFVGQFSIPRLYYFNPLPPHGGRLDIDRKLTDAELISIHSLRMEGDWNTCCEEIDNRLFQSTPSAWRETRHCSRNSTSNRISIHSLRMEGDGRPSEIQMYNIRISIHSLRMEGDIPRIHLRR